VVPWYAWRLSANVVHAPANSFGVLFSLLQQPIIVTVHDLMFLRQQGGSLKQQIGNLYRRGCYFVLPWCRRAVTTVSEASRQELQHSLQEEVSITPNSCQYMLDESASSADAADLALDKPYFVHIGGLTANKNTRRVIEAWNESGVGESFQLVLLGDTKENFEAALPDLRGSTSIVAPGFISSASLIRIVGGAFVSLFPSLEEGFGLPIIEAAFLGVPIITSNRAPMNELAPECSITIDPDSTNDLVAAIRNVSGDTALHRRLSDNTEAVRTRFGRDSLARSLASVYRKALE
jgi:glycosyltransferase involved in cell wall biosynthesis